MPRPDSLHHTTHYQMSDYRHQRSTLRIHPDALALQVWGDAWDDATTPRTDRPARFVWLKDAPDYRPRVASSYYASVRPVFWRAN